MPNPALIMAGIQGGKSILGYLTKRKNMTPRFGNTEYSRYLQKVGQQGTISPTERSNLLSRTASQSGNVAANTRAGIRGYLESRNMGNSMAAAGTLAKPGLQLQRDIYGTSQDIELENERSKTGAQERYAYESYQNQLQRAGQQRQDVSELVSGIGDAAGGYYQAKQDEKSQKEEKEDSMLELEIDIALAKGDIGEAERLMKELKKRRGY